MYLIKSCDSCGRKIRFPIDKGKIRVKCVCGFAFLADPDDPALFRDSTFDLHGKDGGRQSAGDSVEIIPRIIKALLGLKYKLQNFRLLPSREQKRILLILFGILFGLAFLVLLITHLFRMKTVVV